MHVHNDDPDSIFEVTVIIVCQLYLDGGNNNYAIYYNCECICKK